MNFLALAAMPSLDTTPVFESTQTSLIAKRSYDVDERQLVALHQAKRGEILPEIFPQARRSKPPIFLLPPSIDNFFLATPQGKVLRLAIQWLLQKDALTEKSEKEYCEKLNEKLKNGICKGTAITYLLNSRKAAAGVGKPKQALEVKIEKRVAALFDQLSGTLRIALRAYHAKSHDVTATCLDLALCCVEKNPWLAKKTSILAEHVVDKGDAIVAEIKAIFAKTAKAEMLIILSFEGTTGQHMIVVRPGKRKVYDDNFGELYWKKEELLFQDLEYYMKASKVVKATIQIL